MLYSVVKKHLIHLFHNSAVRVMNSRVSSQCSHAIHVSNAVPSMHAIYAWCYHNVTIDNKQTCIYFIVLVKNVFVNIHIKKLIFKKKQT